MKKDSIKNPNNFINVFFKYFQKIHSKIILRVKIVEIAKIKQFNRDLKEIRILKNKNNF